MEVSKPEWMTEEFLIHALKEGDNSLNIKIKNFNVKFAIPKGNNYTSDILRVKIVYSKSSTTEDKKEELTTSLIIKAPITEGDHKMIFEVGVIQKEYKIFNELFPKLKNILGENEEFIGAKSYPSKIEYTLVMEDLNALGYTLTDRFDQLDYKHSEIVLKKMAQLHAATTKLLEDEPELIEEIGTEPVFSRNKTISEKNKKVIDDILGKSQLINLAKEIETWPESKKYADKLYKLADKAWELQYELHDIDDNDFNCLIHADLWSSNMLFKYSKDGLPENVKFVDFQVIHYGDIAFDLYYFLCSSLKFEVLENDLDALLSTYLQHLNENLEKYGSKKRLSKEKFKKIMEAKEIYGFLTSCRILLFVFAEKDEIVDFKDESPEESRFKKYYKSRYFRSNFPKYLDYFSKRSWFQDI